MRGVRAGGRTGPRGDAFSDVIGAFSMECFQNNPLKLRSNVFPSLALVPAGSTSQRRAKKQQYT